MQQIKITEKKLYSFYIPIWELLLRRQTSRGGRGKARSYKKKLKIVNYLRLLYFGEVYHI